MLSDYCLCSSVYCCIIDNLLMDYFNIIFTTDLSTCMTILTRFHGTHSMAQEFLYREGWQYYYYYYYYYVMLFCDHDKYYLILYNIYIYIYIYIYICWRVGVIER